MVIITSHKSKYFENNEWTEINKRFVKIRFANMAFWKLPYTYLLCSEWTSEVVQHWFTSNYGKYRQKFDGLNGKDLVRLSEAQFKSRCPEMGDVIYNAVQELKGKEI